MHRQKDFLTEAITRGVILIISGAIFGLLLFIINVYLSGKTTSASWNPITTERVLAASHKKAVKLELSPVPQQITVIHVYSNNTLAIKGPQTTVKRVSLYLATFPPKNCYRSAEAHEELKKLTLHKHLLVSKDPLANGDQVYLKYGKHFVQDRLLSRGLVAMYNYNGSEKYYHRFMQMEQKARQHQRGIWAVPGYATDQGFSRRKGSL